MRPTETTTAEERAAKISKSKLGPHAYDPFQVVQVSENVVLVDEDGIRVPTSINSCTRAPPLRPTPQDPNFHLDTSDEPRFVDGANDVKDVTRTNPLHDDAMENDSNDNQPYLIRIVYHTPHDDGRVSYDVK